MTASSLSCGRRLSRGMCWARKARRAAPRVMSNSSLERLQVKVRGNLGARYQVTCNGIKVPLKPAAVHGESVAGVRFRAWLPSQCLQPTIAPHTPLVFDLVDSWAGRSIGGCRYHVAHPGGRALRHLPGQRARSRDAAAGAVRDHRPHARTDDAARPRHEPLFPVHPRPAAGWVLRRRGEPPPALS